VPIVTAAGGRIALRTALHGFPAFALHQLRAVREAYLDVEAAVGGASFARLNGHDPLPHEALVGSPDAPLALVLTLAHALGCDADAPFALASDVAPIAHDPSAVAHQVRTTVHGRELYGLLERRVARELAKPEAIVTLRQAIDKAEAMPPTQRSILEGVVAELQAGGWPEVLPLSDDCDE
jgi:hypothetical protein